MTGLLDFYQMSILAKGQNLLENLKFSAMNAGVKKFAPFIIAGTVGYAAADLTLLYIRPFMLPTEAPPVRIQQTSSRKIKSFAEYNAIINRNIFNADGKIPPALSDDGQGPALEADAVLSQLPLTLQGTIVHFNPARSIATIKLNAKSVTQSFIAEEEIDGMAKIVKIDRRRVTFHNLNNRRLEYIEIPDSVAFNFDLKNGAPTNTGPIEELGRNNFVVKRSELERLTQNLSQVLQQARVEPRIGADNQVEGYCFVSIQPATVYETLGFRVGDCITNVNGTPIRSPQDAMNLYNSLRTSHNVQIGIERGGRNEIFNYDVE